MESVSEVGCAPHTLQLDWLECKLCVTGNRKRTILEPHDVSDKSRHVICEFRPEPRENLEPRDRLASEYRCLLQQWHK